MRKLKQILIAILMVTSISLMSGCDLVSSTSVDSSTTISESTSSNVVDSIISSNTGSEITVSSSEASSSTSSETIVSSSTTSSSTIQSSVIEPSSSTIVTSSSTTESSTTIPIQTVETATNRGLMSAVSVYAKFVNSRNVESSSAGSGVIYQIDKTNGDAYFITNYHVVYNTVSTNANKISSEIKVYLFGSELSDLAIPVTYVGGSMNYDIAVLKATGSDVIKNSNAMAAIIGDSDKVVIGSTAIAIGNPEAEGISATSGVVSVDSEYITMTGADDVTSIQFRVIRIDTAVNSGNSGGGLYNIHGELIGIVNAKTVSDSVENIGYAIPINNAISVAKNILYYTNLSSNHTGVNKPLMGITVQITNSKAVFDSTTNLATKIETVTVIEVTSGSLADGKFQVNDVLQSITINGVTKDITRMFIVSDFMLYAHVGDTVRVAVLRNNETVNLDLTLTASEITNVA